MSVNESIQAILIERFKRAAVSILQYLNYRRDPNITNSFGTTLLHMVTSASLDNLAIVQYLYDLGANINAQDNNQLTPLHLAVSQSNYKIAHFLIAQGAAVNIQEKRGKTALHLLIDDTGLQKLQKKQDKQKKDLLLVKLLQSGADPNLPDIYGETPLMRAARQNDCDSVKELLMFGGNVHFRNVDSDTCLHLLTWSFEPNKDILVELLKHGACVNCFGSLGKSVIDFMLQYYQPEEGLETVKLLIKIATLVNWKSKIYFELETNSEFYCLQEFIDSCYTEVARMKSCSYSDKSNLCHFALNGGNVSQKDKSFGKTIFDEVFETLMKDNFPIYNDFIRGNFDRTFLFEKSLKMNIYATNEDYQKNIHLNSDSMFEIASYLSDKDLFSLVTAYSKSDVMLIKKDKTNLFAN
ncbi:unnamed protein product [Larinioides sclopetarius]|uniref:Ankyrin repeat protein n=1 Tax=Larinioides sclopetarius TaxID=280406 RepID=A0AAV2AMW0_9ARAC